MEIIGTYPTHPANYHGGRAQPIQYLVMHYVGASGGGKANANYYHSTPNIGASAHYFVGHGSEGAAVYAGVPEGDTAWHCGQSSGQYKHPYCRNANSIGIELCCHQDSAGRWYFDRETVERGVELAREIVGRYQIPPSNVLRHYDVTGKRCPRPWVDSGPAWAQFKRRVFEKEEEEMEIYTSVEGAPAWAQETIRRAMRTPSREGGGTLLSGDGQGKLRLTGETIVTLELLRKAGLLSE